LEKWETLICVGPEAGVMAEIAKREGLADVRIVADALAAATALSSLVQPGDLVLLKASRSAHMEEVLNHFN
jgi:UDP-N-acetylmuramyl pentapeptide synthase